MTEDKQIEEMAVNCYNNCEYWQVCKYASYDEYDSFDDLKNDCEFFAPKVGEAEWILVRNGFGECTNCHRIYAIDHVATHCRYCGALIEGDERDECARAD